MKCFAFSAAILFNVATLLSSPVSAQSIKPQPVKVNLAYIGITASNWTGLVAQQKGFFKEEGLDIDWIVTGQSAKSAQQVMAGVAQFGNSTVPDTFRAIDAGGDLVAFVNALGTGVHQLIAAKSVKTIHDLKGKRVMVGGQKDITGLWWYAMARHFGLDPFKDVDLLFAGSTSNRFAALVSGAIDATVLSPPTSYQAMDMGFVDLGPVAPYMGEFPMSIYHVNKTWAAKNKDKVLAFVRAHNRAAKYMLDPVNRQEVSEILAKASNSTLQDALRTYDLVVKVKGVVPDGALAQSTVDRVLQMLLADGDIKSQNRPRSDYFDSQYVDAAK